MYWVYKNNSRNITAMISPTFVVQPMSRSKRVDILAKEGVWQ